MARHRKRPPACSHKLQKCASLCRWPRMSYTDVFTEVYESSLKLAVHGEWPECEPLTAHRSYMSARGAPLQAPGEPQGGSASISSLQLSRPYTVDCSIWTAHTGWTSPPQLVGRFWAAYMQNQRMHLDRIAFDRHTI